MPLDPPWPRSRLQTCAGRGALLGARAGSARLASAAPKWGRLPARLPTRAHTAEQRELVIIQVRFLGSRRPLRERASKLRRTVLRAPMHATADRAATNEYALCWQPLFAPMAAHHGAGNILHYDSLRWRELLRVPQ